MDTLRYRRKDWTNCVAENIEAKAKGKTILLVEQNASIALDVADRGYVLENGSIALEGKGHDLLNDPEVKKVYLGI